VAILSDFTCIFESLAPTYGEVSLWAMNHYRSLLARRGRWSGGQASAKGPTTGSPAKMNLTNCKSN
jgi:hypothetical protein